MRTAVAIRRMLGLSLVLCAVASLAAGRDVQAQKTSGARPVVPETVIQLRNDSASVLDFYIVEGARWRPLRLTAR
jgi:hypothetical protein